MFIYICCAGGMSSSMFCIRMADAINDIYPSLKATSAHISTVLSNEKGYSEKYDIILIYGGIDIISNSNAYEIGELLDVVFVAPQVSYLLASKQEILKEYPVILKLIDKKIFGSMNGSKASGDLLNELVALDLERSFVSSKIVGTKNSDKNIEILLNGVDQKGGFAKQLINSFEEMGLRVVQGKYSIESLYNFQPKDDYDIR